MSERIKKFPIRCVECGQKTVFHKKMNRIVRRKFPDGYDRYLLVENCRVNVCSNCGEIYFSSDGINDIQKVYDKMMKEEGLEW
jgi:YgiT-type zinc finger domain-containing protein